MCAFFSDTLLQYRMKNFNVLSS